MDTLEIAKVFKKSIQKICKEVVEKETKSCFRVYKATVKTAPYTNENGVSVCDVLLDDEAFSQNVMQLPYSSSLSSMSVGDVVLVAKMFGSWRNAIVWESIFFN